MVDPQRKRSAIGLLLRAAGSGALLYWILTHVPLHRIGDVLARADVRLAGAALLLHLLARGISALRTYQVTRAQGLPLRYAQVLHALLATNFYGLALPGQLAGSLVTVQRYRRLGADVGSAVVALVFSRATETIAYVSLGLLFAAADVHFALGMPVLIALACVLVAAGVPYGVALSGNAQSGLAGLARGRLEGRPWLRRVAARIYGLLEPLRTLSLAKLALVTALSVAQILLVGLAGWLFAHALGIELGYATVVWVLAVVFVAMILPVSLLGLGVREGLVLVLLAPYGVEAPDAVAWSFLLMLGVLTVAAAGGLVELRSVFAGAAGGADAPATRSG